MEFIFVFIILLYSIYSFHIYYTFLSKIKRNYDSLHLKTIVYYLSGISDKIINGICKVIQLILPRYRDSSSHFYIKTLLTSLIKEHPVWTIKYMTIVLADIASQNKNIVAT